MPLPLLVLVGIVALAHSATITVSWGTSNSSATDLPILINSGDTIIFSLNQDALVHTVTTSSAPSSGAFASGDIPAGGTLSQTFTILGQYNLKCDYHAGMTGVVLVGCAYLL